MRCRFRLQCSPRLAGKQKRVPLVAHASETGTTLRSATA
ncbi:hypothetical protein XOC_0617 [Xanthomonas oryzae pv. oryzicola BLS256]|uniref:Uncharacterized protein n=1 Tax=Xanthomonas oryzae pv. oryzicola (strain BLS256) TaxID=383407 RepID=G7TBE6_XANOB|nr:hypothetical protein XOC_0617 [Xanthomonas oryzae pv. oryzicola BLS256]QEO99329.1 hypothetical protein XOCgx_4342 [Xanthomonas oryzae pv. oryzicola]